MKSPLLFPVKLEEDKIVVIDETLLPFQEKYIEVTTLEGALSVLGEMKTRALGQVLLFFYSCVLFEKDVSIDEISCKFKVARPTFDFLFLAKMLYQQIQAGLSLRQAAAGFIFRFDELRKKRAGYLARLLPNPANILTICNLNGEFIYLYEEMAKLGKSCSFFVCETRPYLQGARLTFWELQKNGICVLLICDNQAAILMKDKKVNCVITGADRAALGGGIINKVGTYSLARLAKYFNIPFYPLTQYPREIDLDKVEIEQRPAREVFMFVEDDCSQIPALYPAFDVVKREFISAPIELTNVS